MWLFIHAGIKKAHLLIHTAVKTIQHQPIGVQNKFA